MFQETLINAVERWLAREDLGEWPYSHRSFDDQDVNGDGIITRDEFRAGTLPSQGR